MRVYFVLSMQAKCLKIIFFFITTKVNIIFLKVIKINVIVLETEILSLIINMQKFSSVNQSEEDQMLHSCQHQVKRYCVMNIEIIALCTFKGIIWCFFFVFPIPHKFYSEFIVANFYVCSLWAACMKTMSIVGLHPHQTRWSYLMKQLKQMEFLTPSSLLVNFFLQSLLSWICICL